MCYYNIILNLLELTTKLPPFYLRTEAQKRLAFNQAKELAGDKGIINLGAGNTKMGFYRSPFAYSVAHSNQVTANVDITPNGVSNFVEWNLEETPYPFSDKQFDVVFASHVLEHLDNWQDALDEMMRIADYVVIAVPHPLDFFAIFNPHHKQHFSFDKIKSIADSSENIFMYY